MTDVHEGYTESEEIEDEQRTVVRTQQVKKIYTMGEIEVHALRGVDMEIYTGEYLSIMGPSGSGKSTLVNEVLAKAANANASASATDISCVSAKRLHHAVLAKIVSMPLPFTALLRCASVLVVPLATTGRPAHGSHCREALAIASSTGSSTQSKPSSPAASSSQLLSRCDAP